MRRLFIAIPASLLLVSAYAGAQSRDYPLRSDDSSISTVEVTANRPLNVSSERDSVKGIYALSNGWGLKVEPTRAGIIARIDDEPPLKLAAITGTKFRTSDGNVEMQFNLGQYGEDMTMSYVPRSDVAARITVSTDSSLASR
jgi:hypothetical protein